MPLTENEVASLLHQEPIHDEWPWNTKDESAIHRSLKEIIAEIRGMRRLLDKTEFGHYGSGYASYVDCWLYREDEEFRFDSGNCYWGLVLLFSTLSKYFVVGQGQKTWHGGGGSSYLPSFESVDDICHPAIQGIVNGVCEHLTSRGLIRLHADDLSEPLASHIIVPTNLADRPWRQFDALFYWED